MSRRRRAAHGWWSASEAGSDQFEDDYDYDGDEPNGAEDDWLRPPPLEPPYAQPPYSPRPPSADLQHATPRFEGPRAADPESVSWTGAPAWSGPSAVPDAPERRIGADPLTDPRGFAPVPPTEAAVDPAEAAALAGAFAADYLSWDETDPQRRAGVIAHYLADGLLGADADHARLGWNGHGRQRAEFALPGAVLADGDGRVTVDVRVRVTPYRVVGAVRTGEPEDETEVAGVPAAAPAPTARGWKSLGSYWVRLSVPVTRERGRLVVDASDEQLGGRPVPAPTSATPPTPVEEPDVDGDDIGAPPVAMPPPVAVPPTPQTKAGRKSSNGRLR